MAKTRKLRKSKKSKKINKRIGGILEDHGLPEVNELSQFRITDENLLNFNRVFDVPMDCFINALQLMGVFNPLTANIMRVSTLGVTGFTKPQIEIIFSFTFGHNFDFKPTKSYHEWAQWINRYLQPNHVVFAGYTEHVFIIGRMANGTLVYIDPQVPAFCNLDTDTACQSHLLGKDDYYLLFNSTEQLTKDQADIMIAYTQHLQKEASK
jgi:hypothetical protein